MPNSKLPSLENSAETIVKSAKKIIVEDFTPAGMNIFSG
jgi:hypothetical protein